MTSQPLSGQTAVVTGASSGIGKQIAEALLAAGARVVLAARSAGKLESLAAKLGPNAFPLFLDVTSEEGVKLAFERLYERHGAINILVNNAGFGRFEPVAEAAPESFGCMMDVNYFGLVRCTRAVLPHMLAERSGTIVNIASIAGKMGTAKSAGYAASKHAVLGFTNALRQEMYGTGVHVLAVNPGPVKTAFFDLADPQGGYVNRVKWMMVTPERVARETVNGIVRGKAEVNVPGWFGAAARIGQVLPVGLVNALAARFLTLK